METASTNNDAPITPTALARLAGISVPFASQILSGKRKPSPAMARRIEDAGGPPACLTRPDVFGACDGDALDHANGVSA